jgi:hypothetical protein
MGKSKSKSHASSAQPEVEAQAVIVDDTPNVLAAYQEQAAKTAALAALYAEEKAAENALLSQFADRIAPVRDVAIEALKGYKAEYDAKVSAAKAEYDSKTEAALVKAEGHGCPRQYIVTPIAKTASKTREPKTGGKQVRLSDCAAILGQPFVLNAPHDAAKNGGDVSVEYTVVSVEKTDDKGNTVQSFELMGRGPAKKDGGEPVVHQGNISHAARYAGWHAPSDVAFALVRKCGLDSEVTPKSDPSALTVDGIALA